MAVERVVFVAVLHRLFVSSSDRACEKWMADYAIPVAGQVGRVFQAVGIALPPNTRDRNLITSNPKM